LLVILVNGHECRVISQGDDETEFEKRLGTELLEGSRMVSIDNCDASLADLVPRQPTSRQPGPDQGGLRIDPPSIEITQRLARSDALGPQQQVLLRDSALTRVLWLLLSIFWRDFARLKMEL
jgi:hypothetical protein